MRCLFLLLAAYYAMSASGHICLISPRQRGDFAIGEGGEAACYRRTPYCGGVKPGPPTATYTAGALATITFQQNLNHFWPTEPGHLDVAIASGSNPSDEDFTVMQSVGDIFGIEMIQQNNFTMQVRMPAQASTHSVVRVRYVAKNPMERDPPTNMDAIFYNCADVQIVVGAGSVESSTETLVAKSSPEMIQSTLGALENSAMDCVAPARFNATFAENTTTGNVLHTIHWDATHNRTRWQRRGHWHSPLVEEDETMFNDYNIPQEYQIRGDGFCYLYGHDQFLHWEFGSTRGMRFLPTESNAKMRTWISGDDHLGKKFYAVVRPDGTCIPSGWSHAVTLDDGASKFNTAKMLEFTELETIDERTFVPPTKVSSPASKNTNRDCQPSPELAALIARVGCGGHGLKAADVLV